MRQSLPLAVAVTWRVHLELLTFAICDVHCVCGSRSRSQHRHLCICMHGACLVNMYDTRPASACLPTGGYTCKLLFSLARSCVSRKCVTLADCLGGLLESLKDRGSLYLFACLLQCWTAHNIPPCYSNCLASSLSLIACQVSCSADCFAVWLELHRLSQQYNVILLQRRCMQQLLGGMFSCLPSSSSIR